MKGMKIVGLLLLVLCLGECIHWDKYKDIRVLTDADMVRPEGDLKWKPLNYTQSSYWYDEQLVSHSDPLDNKRTFSQRYWVIEDFFNPAKGPVFLYICGEWSCSGVGRNAWPVYLAQQFNGLLLTLEHRYYGQSQPFGNQSFKLENMKYLTVFEALDDLAYFINWVKSNGKYRVTQDNPWVSIGGSYPGAMSAWFRYKYPHLTIGALASSAVVNAIVNFTTFDEQIKVSTSVSGDFCPKAIHDMAFNLQDMYVNNKSQALQYQAKFVAGGYDPLKLTPGEFLFYFADIFVILVQYGDREYLCNLLQNKTLQQQYDTILDYTLKNKITVDQYGAYYLSNTTYTPSNVGYRQWTYQYCSEFGWLQTAPDVDSMRSDWVNLTMFSQLCQESFGTQIWPAARTNNIQFGGLDLEAYNIVFTNGSQDPWQKASLLNSSKNMISIVIECGSCAHCVDLRQPLDTDPVQLQNARSMQVYYITKWLGEYQNGKYSPLYQ